MAQGIATPRLTVCQDACIENADTVYEGMSNVTYGTVCSGIECVGAAVVELGWKGVFLSEIDPFAAEFLRVMWGEIPNFGDMTQLAGKIRNGEVPLCDVIAAGTPCQAFSISGARESLSDDRGNLTLEFIHIVDELDAARAAAGLPPAIILWENVPGVFSVNDNAFGCFLAGLVGAEEAIPPIGSKGRWSRAGMVRGPKRSAAWRVLDAQYFGVPQRRERVFVIAGAGNGFDPSEILFECDGVRRDSAPSRKEAQETAEPVSSGFGGNGEGHYVVNIRQTPISEKDVCPPLDTLPSYGIVFGGGNTSGSLSVATACTTSNQRLDFDTETFVVQGLRVRRLTPRECERLQGLPDDYTMIPWRGKNGTPDSKRYKAIGNGMAVPVIQWLCRRIDTYLAKSRRNLA